jgi:hypothetical protein
MDESGQAAGADPLFCVLDQGTEQGSLLTSLPTVETGGHIGLFLVAHE